MSPPDSAPGNARDPQFVAPDDFDFIEKVGAGASGEVWRAMQRSTGRFVAVKVLSPVLTSSSSEPERAAKLAWRFQREIEAAAQQDHPNIAKVHVSGVTCGRSWFAMEFVDGQPFDEFAAAVPLRERLALFQQVCAGVQHAHDNGIIHRDLKPANILVRADGTPKILDFGIAHFLDDAGLGPTLTFEGQSLGTPMFMPPEQVAGKIREVGVTADVYALGVLLYQVATGDWPYDKTLPPLALLAAVRETEPKPIRGVPGDLAAIVGKAMAREKADRYASVRALSEDVAHFLAGELVAARAWTIRYIVRKRLRKHWRSFGVVATLFLLIAVFAAIYLEQRRRAAERTAQTLQQAKELVNTLIFDMHGKLDAIGHPELLSDVAERVAKFPWDAENDESGTLDLRRFQALTAQVRGDVFFSKGDVSNALTAYNEASAHFGALVEQHPDERRFQYDAATVRISIANTLLKVDKREHALVVLHRLLETLEKTSIPASPDLNKILIAAHGTAGTTLVDLKRLPEAEREFAKALALTVEDSDEAARLNREICLFNVKRGLPEAALTAGRKAEDHYRRILASKPGDWTASLNLARCLTGEGAAYREANDFPACLRSLGEAHDLLRDPNDASLMLSVLPALAVCEGYRALAAKQTARGDHAAALISDQEALQMAQSIYARNQNSRPAHSFLYELRRDMGALLLALHRENDAGEALQDALSHAMEMAKQRPSDPRWQLAGAELNLQLIDLPLQRHGGPVGRRIERAATCLQRLDAMTKLTSAQTAELAELHQRLSAARAKIDELPVPVPKITE